MGGKTHALNLKTSLEGRMVYEKHKGSISDRARKGIQARLKDLLSKGKKIPKNKRTENMKLKKTSLGKAPE